MRTAISLLILSLAFVTDAHAGETLDPGKTRVLVVGILNWKDAGISSFATKDRKDREFHDTFEALGVPPEQTELLLDGDATLENITRRLTELASRSKEGDTLVFYYAGHGAIVEETIYLLNYDYDGGKAAETGLSIPLVTRILEKHFKGSRLLLFGDCCHSGGLAHVARDVAKSPRVRAASLTSAEDCNVSTGNWTFTLTLLDGLRGAPITDANADGSVTLGEMAVEVRDAMKCRERQRYGYATHGVNTDLGMARARGDTLRGTVGEPFRLKEYVNVRLDRGSRVGRILGAEEGKLSVQLQGYSDREIVRVEPAKLLRLEFDRYEKGTQIQVLWKKRLWKAKVLRRDGDFHWITYPGWPHVWDEWVLSNRILPAKPWSDAEAEARASCDGRYSHLLKKIKVAKDLADYGLFNEEGFFKLAEWGGHKNLPNGHWVYVYPHWFIWRDRR